MGSISWPMFDWLFYWLPENISTYGAKIDGIMKMIWVIVFSWFVVVELVLFYFIFRYRAKEGGRASFQPGHGKAVLWILIPAALVLACDLAIDVRQNPVWDEIKINMPKPEEADQEIEINAQQFAWNFVMPGRDGSLKTADDIKVMGTLTLPVGAKVIFYLTSQDVIHSFWVPVLRLKQDAVPGRRITGWFQATKEGTYIIGCAELCGSGHGVMKAKLRILSPHDYEEWLEKESPETAEETAWKVEVPHE
ncbi:MAG: cytochrome c oxidase subunit II [Deltaproteobacteria bacterium]|nr:cytochrome c oxidase subunit II [Deltaproteobacteria bacterium]